MVRNPSPRKDVGNRRRAYRVHPVAKLVHAIVSRGAEMLITAEVRGEALSPLQNGGVATTLRPAAGVMIGHHVVIFDIGAQGRNGFPRILIIGIVAGRL